MLYYRYESQRVHTTKPDKNRNFYPADARHVSGGLASLPTRYCPVLGTPFNHDPGLHCLFSHPSVAEPTILDCSTWCDGSSWSLLGFSYSSQ